MAEDFEGLLHDRNRRIKCFGGTPSILRQARSNGGGLMIKEIYTLSSSPTRDMHLMGEGG